MGPKLPGETLSGSSPALSTRDRILRAAKTLFAARGFEHASTSSIARTAGTSESQLMKYFGSKAGLLEAIFSEAWDRITRQSIIASRTVPSPIEKLQIVSTVALTSIESDPEMKLLMLLEGYRIGKDGQMVALTENFRAFLQLLDRILFQMSTSNLLRPGLNPHAVRSALMGMMEGMMRDRYVAERQSFPASYTTNDIGQVLRLMLDSLTVHNGHQS